MRGLKDPILYLLSQCHTIIRLIKGRGLKPATVL
jgi:hypothetical protein